MRPQTQLFPQLIDPNLDKSSKSEIWTRLKNNEDTRIRKKITFNEKIGPTTYAPRASNTTKLSCFF